MRHQCPHCHAELLRVPRSHGVGALRLSLATELLWWVALLACAGLGLIEPVAGGVAAAIALAITVYWLRSRSQFRCARCERSFARSELRA